MNALIENYNTQTMCLQWKTFFSFSVNVINQTILDSTGYERTFTFAPDSYECHFEP